jgi:putative sigma-54 modulation protein
MQVTVSGRHMAINDAVDAYCREKAGRLTRFFDRIQSIEVILDGKDGQHSAEFIVHSEHTHPFVGHESHADLYAAVDLALDKVEEQVRRHKEKLRNRKHPPRAGSEMPTP